jgi:small subunit ribosomal protein S2
LFVGTKKQAKNSVKSAAIACNMPFVNVRWLGGTFTNFKTIQKTIRKMERLENLKASGDLKTKYTKKERLLIEREMIKLEKLFSGIRNLRKLPEMLFVADINHDDTAVREARKMHVPVIGLVDSNSDPALVDFAIPCNDDATKAVSLVAGIIAEAVTEGQARYGAQTKEQAVQKEPAAAVVE